MIRQAEVYLFNKKTGLLTENENGYTFQYDNEYLQCKDAISISQLLPLTDEAYKDRILFPFFDGLIPEGWLLEIATENWKLDSRDRMGLLLACCKDCIGAASIYNISDEGES
jgi:serine/threonine-protein kinase HipA